MPTAPRSLGSIVVLAALIFGGALVISSSLIAHGYEESKRSSYDDTVTVTGQASQTIEADTAKWSLRLSRENATSSVEALLRRDGEALKEILKSKQIDDADVSFHPIENQSSNGYGEYDSRNWASQVVVIESKHVTALGALAESGSTLLADRGAEIQTTGIEFFSDNIDDVQNRLAKEALLNAQMQAKTLIGSRLGRLNTVSDARFQVTPLRTSNESYYQQQDTSSIKKKVMATITVSFRLD